MSFLNDILNFFYDDIRKTSFLSNKYVHIVFISIIMGLASMGAYMGYTKYRVYKNQEAQKILAVCLEEYARAVSGAVELWPTVEMSCQLGYEQHSNADIAPYFLAIQVEALLHQGKKDAVQPLLDTMMQQMNTSSPLYYLYQTQKALIELDAHDAAIVKKGLDSLHMLAEDKKNNNRDIALYYMGLYYWAKNQIADAQTEWTELVAQFPTSPWVSVVSTKLQQIA